MKSAPLLNQRMQLSKLLKFLIICLMDADDIFFQNKLSYINNFFSKKMISLKKIKI